MNKQATTATKFAAKLADLKANGVKDLATITRMISQANTPELLSLLADCVGYEGPKMQAEAAEQARKFLLGLHYTPTGKEKEPSPFGYRELAALENFGSIVWADNYVLNYQYGTRTPLFNVHEADGSFGFQYYMQGGKISIVG